MDKYISIISRLALCFAGLTQLILAVVSCRDTDASLNHISEVTLRFLLAGSLAGLNAHYRICILICTVHFLHAVASHAILIYGSFTLPAIIILIHVPALVSLISFFATGISVLLKMLDDRKGSKKKRENQVFKSGNMRQPEQAHVGSESFYQYYS